MILCGSSHRFSWFTMVVVGSQRFLVVLVASQWFYVVLTGSRRFSVVLVGSQWLS